jgi:nitroreductase/NAD-dependent dihydropyrimidine dehydrogenase PreA subunit
MALIHVDHKKCEKKWICVEVCPLEILALDPEQGPQVRPGMGNTCIACGHCVAACPHGALDNVRNPLARQTPLPPYPLVDAATAFNFLRSRRSIRCYRDAPVPRTILRQLLEIARYAPSGHNSQGLAYIVVEGDTALDRVRSVVLAWMRGMIQTQPQLAEMLHLASIVKASEAGRDMILRGAPQLVVATGENASRMAQVSTTLALEYVEIYATALGLGTCWAGYVQVCAQQHPGLATLLRVPENRMITGAMMVGYPKYRYHQLPERDPLQVTWHADDSSGLPA